VKLLRVWLTLLIVLAAPGLLALTVSNSQVSVGTTATKIGTATGRFQLVVVNSGSTAAYCGTTASVTSGTGFPIQPQASLNLGTPHQALHASHTSAASVDWWCITASGTTTLGVIEVKEP
jgi:hypothetical protein